MAHNQFPMSFVQLAEMSHRVHQYYKDSRSTSSIFTDDDENEADQHRRSKSDLDALSVTQSDHWTLRTSSLTASMYVVLHIGMLSGKAILAFGKAEIKVMKWVWLRYRRRVIDSKFPHYDEDNIRGLDKLYDDLVDFSRFDIYDHALNTWALDHLHSQTALGCTDELSCSFRRAPTGVRLQVLWSLCKRGPFLDWSTWHVNASNVKSLHAAATPVVHGILDYIANNLNHIDAGTSAALAGVATLCNCSEEEETRWLNLINTEIHASEGAKQDIIEAIGIVETLGTRLYVAGELKLCIAILRRTLHVYHFVLGGSADISIGCAFLLNLDDPWKPSSLRESQQASAQGAFERMYPDSHPLADMKKLFSWHLAAAMKHQQRYSEEEVFYRGAS